MINKKVFVLLSFLVSTCLAQYTETSVHVKTVNAKNKEISIFETDLFGNINVFDKKKIDSTGEVVLKMGVNYPYFAFINLGELNQMIYIKPDSHYELTLDYSTEKTEIKFDGKDAAINNYLEQFKEHFRGFKYNNKGYAQWNKSEYPIGMQKLDSLTKAEQKVFFDANNISAKEKELLMDYTLSLGLSHKMNHLQARYDVVSTKSQDIPIILRDLETLVPFNELLLQTGAESYLIALKYYYSLVSIKKLVATVNTENKKTVESYLKFVFEDISGYNIPSDFKEFMLADLMVSCMIQKIPANFDEYFNKFKENFQTSKYINLIDNRLLKLMKLTRGNEAKEILAADVNNKAIKLGNFMGKIVFIDFWATWCGPCIKELPNSVELQNKFKANKDEIVFLYVSVDQNKEKWKNYLAKHPELSGIHVRIDDDKMMEVKQAYALYAVPRYVIVGKDGKIVDANLEPPSSGKVEAKLSELLKQ